MNSSTYWGGGDPPPQNKDGQPILRDGGPSMGQDRPPWTDRGKIFKKVKQRTKFYPKAIPSILCGYNTVSNVTQIIASSMCLLVQHACHFHAELDLSETFMYRCLLLQHACHFHAMYTRSIYNIYLYCRWLLLQFACHFCATPDLSVTFIYRCLLLQHACHFHAELDLSETFMYRCLLLQHACHLRDTLTHSTYNMSVTFMLR